MDDKEIYIAVKEGRLTKDEAVILLKANLIQKKMQNATAMPKKVSKEMNVTMSAVNHVQEEKDIKDIVIEACSKVLHLSRNEIPTNLEFDALGVDSISGVEIIRDINQKCHCNLDVTALYDYQTVDKLSDYLKSMNVTTPTTTQASQLNVKNVYVENKDKNYDYNNQRKRTISLEPLGSKEKASVQTGVRPGEKIVLGFGQNHTTSTIKESQKCVLEPKAMNSSKDMVKDYLEQIVRKVLHINEIIDVNATLREVGVDSITSVEIVRDINQVFGTSYDATVLYDYPTISVLKGLIESDVSPARLEELKKKQ